MYYGAGRLGNNSANSLMVGAGRAFEHTIYSVLWNLSNRLPRCAAKARRWSLPLDASTGPWLLGNPISDLMSGEDGDGSGAAYDQQWFEKGRLEWHLNVSQPQPRVVLGSLGSESLYLRGWLPARNRSATLFWDPHGTLQPAARYAGMISGGAFRVIPPAAYLYDTVSLYGYLGRRRSRRLDMRITALRAGF